MFSRPFGCHTACTRFSILPALTRLAAAAGILSLGAATASAQVSTGNLTVTATVANVCTIGATMLDFSVLNLGAPTTEATPGNVEVICTANQGNVQVTIGSGQFPSGLERRMSNGAGGFIPYSIYTSSSRTSALTTDGQIFGGALTGSVPQNFAIYGRAFGGATNAAGTYNDVLLITLT